MSIDNARRTVGPGWRVLVEECYQVLVDTGRPCTVLQVKEKFGGLRFYWAFTEHLIPDTRLGMLDAARRVAQTAIDDIERRSMKTCEVCGAPGTVQQRKSGWYKATCGPEHLQP